MIKVIFYLFYKTTNAQNVSSEHQ